MPPLDYLLARFIRRRLPSGITSLLLRRGWIIKPGLETSDPRSAVERYARVLAQYGLSLEGKRVLDFGYGGYFGVGVELLRHGACHVVLCDPFARPDPLRNRLLLKEYGEFLKLDRGQVWPEPAHFTLLEKDVRQVQPGELPPFDLVLSTSVYEHLDDPLGVTQALARLTHPQGAHLHFVDLRDHFFKYPFEMLCYAESTWRRWLNPTSNLNRYRLWDYRRAFESFFQQVTIEVLGRDEDAFRRVQHRVLPRFQSGDLAQDSVTLIQVFARFPLGEVSIRDL
uniref:Hypothetical conserved protein n=1 Tax=uncultured Chloroflexota bacterium TaxID=166587 RepID=H5SQ61_9CHLR|nr:hypothetical conserved protein [uncultured Chloroflexota bacterium]